MIKKERLFTKKDWIHMTVVAIIMIVSICAGMSVYMFFVYGYISVFPDYTFFSVINFGGIAIMFFVTMRIYRFFLYYYNDYKIIFSGIRETHFSNVEAKKVKIETPDKDWLKER